MYQSNRLQQLERYKPIMESHRQLHRDGALVKVVALGP